MRIKALRHSPPERTARPSGPAATASWLERSTTLRIRRNLPPCIRNVAKTDLTKSRRVLVVLPSLL